MKTISKLGRGAALIALLAIGTMVGQTEAASYQLTGGNLAGLASSIGKILKGGSKAGSKAGSEARVIRSVERGEKESKGSWFTDRASDVISYESEKVTCSQCGGSGVVVWYSPYQSYPSTATCPQCNGSGKVARYFNN